MAVGAVGEGEFLWRNVRPEEVSYPDGQLKISATAFNDFNKQPSVDRKDLRNDPSETRKGPDDGVAQLVTRDVRAIAIQVDPNAKDNAKKTQIHHIDVIAREILADPVNAIAENLAHAQIEASPGYINDTRFKKLKDALCRLAESQPWAIGPKPKSPG